MLRLLLSRFSNRQYDKTILMVLLSITLVACDGKQQDAKEPITGIEKVRIGTTQAPPSWLTILAKEKHFYRKHGLDVTTIAYKSGKRAFKGMFEDEVDIATVADGPIVFASLKRNDFSIFATIGTSSNDNVIVAAKDSGITKLADLQGKRFATQSSSAAHFYMHLFMLQNGLYEKGITESFMKVEQLPQALADKKVDAIATREPFLSKAVNLLGTNAIVFETPGLYLKSFELVAYKTYANKNKSILIKILKALLDSELFLIEHKTEATEILSRTLDISKDSVSKSLKSLNLSIRLEQSLILNLEDEARWVIKNKLSTKNSMPNFLEYISTEALSLVKPERMTLTISD